MKKLLKLTLAVVIATVGMTLSAEAQILKGFGKKLEKKIEERIERKTDRQVDKVLDKADKKSDEPIDNVLNTSRTRPKDKPANQGKLKEKPTVFEEIPVNANESVLLMGSNCTDLSWFKKGAELAYEVFDNKGRLEGETQMKVRNLLNEGTATIAQVDASMKTPHLGDLRYQMNYICDGDKLYMDIGAMMKAMMENNPQLKNQNKEVQEAFDHMEMDFENGFASFPKQMYTGMRLDDLSFSFKTKSGSTEMSFQTEVTHRQVVAKEKVTTDAGTFECVKIRSVSNTTIRVMGFDQAMPQSIEYLWIAPSIGMVKQEIHADKELTSVVQLKAYTL